MAEHINESDLPDEIREDLKESEKAVQELVSRLQLVADGLETGKRYTLRPMKTRRLVRLRSADAPPRSYYIVRNPRPNEQEIEEYYKEIAERSARYEQGQYIDQVESKPSLLVRFWRWLTAVAVPPADKGREL